jgi:tetraacyldisaccharide 4'-kinase
LKTLNVTFQHLKYADHHYFSENEIRNIKTNFGAIQARRMILTTEKDFVRLEPHLQNLSYLPIETSFLNNENEAFNTLITSHLKESF